MAYQAPSGHIDVLEDGLAAVNTNPFEVLEIEGYGVVMARRPMPCAVGALGNAVNNKADDSERGSFVGLFVQDHLDHTSWDELIFGLMEGRYTDDTTNMICRAIATWGTARPYQAIVNLANLTAAHWRVIRHKLLTAGIPDPMALPSLHQLLDATETLCLESFVSNKPAKDKADRERFLDALYRPDPKLAAVNGDGYKPVPAGFEDGGDDDWSWEASGAE